MGLRFVLLVNKLGQTRLAQYYETVKTAEEKRTLEAEIVRKCLGRNDQQCSLVEHRGYKVIYKRYASLFFLVAVDQNEVREPTNAAESSSPGVLRDACGCVVVF
eukprot:scaffold2298_cov388-Prasinococcus_capsulatus_cf.AAC.7